MRLMSHVKWIQESNNYVDVRVLRLCGHDYYWNVRHLI